MLETNGQYINVNDREGIVDKVISLFQFIREMNKLKNKPSVRIQDYPWYCALSQLPDDPENIQIKYRDRVDEDSEESDTDDDNILLSVRKPVFNKCPAPLDSFEEWLINGWDSPDDPVSIKLFYDIELSKQTIHNGIFDEVELQDKAELYPDHEYFGDNYQRVYEYNEWLSRREDWIDHHRLLKQTENLFTDLYKLYFGFRRDSETSEIIVANGMLCDNNNNIKHPVLTRRVRLDYDAEENIVNILDTDTPSELYSIVFQVMENINTLVINDLNDKLKEEDYHPLDRNETPSFLKILVHQLSSESLYTEQDIPEDWDKTNRLLMYQEPVYIVRKRLDGTEKAIDEIIDNINNTGLIPAPIVDIVNGGKKELPIDQGEKSIEEQLAAVGGESLKILLSKEANLEQLEIANRIESFNAVLVQGPPGTGKTHTIANLMGHFLAQGKSVLVTSYTSKALAVLKEKVAGGLQNLCVSALEDSNNDMEESIDGITEYMSKTTSSEIYHEMEYLEGERIQIVERLAEVRRRIFSIIQLECNTIVYNGEEFSPSRAAQFITDHREDLSYIPGKVRPDIPLPLSFDELTILYRSNESLSVADEDELADDLPNPSSLIDPADYSSTLDLLHLSWKQLDKIKEETGWNIHVYTEEECLEIEGLTQPIAIDSPNKEQVQDLLEFTDSFGKIDGWMKEAAVDGESGSSYRKRWEILIEQIKKTVKISESVIEKQFGKDIFISEQGDKDELISIFESLKNIFERKGKIGKFALMRHNEYEIALDSAQINGKRVKSVEDCDLILDYIRLEKERDLCSRYWNELIAAHGVSAFYDLDPKSPERIAKNWISQIQRYLDWYAMDYQPLLEKMDAICLPADSIFQNDPLDSDFKKTEKILYAVEFTIPKICEACEVAERIEVNSTIINATKVELLSGKRGNSRICTSLLQSIEEEDARAYAKCFSELELMYEKYDLQKKRKDLLQKLDSAAPDWADAIRRRAGIHGSFTVPDHIEDAWKWKQLYIILEDIISRPFTELQQESMQLSKDYRLITSRYAEKCGWYHLLKRTETDIDMRQALQGWKQTIKQIGKGTGKRAPALKVRARELMAKCQDAVPGWIMTINRALESLDPKKNRFDIIIIDEASQADISSLAILYMGKKYIIVGDDKQVTPMGVGIDFAREDTLQKTYIKGKIPNYHLYNSRKSIYDIAGTTFQPLMLREHFRCVPEIIGFSNMLSYNYMIKPLRDSGDSVLLPAVVNYRVKDGERNDKRKQNRKEAEAIVALIRACIEQPEYEGKSIGVISLLGDEQAKLIQNLVFRDISIKEIEERNILCGNSAHFQGDERDIVFLSLVDSNNENGPIRKRGENDEDLKKRYNVAASRARDQLWVVHSLDYANDLKEGDLRRKLIEYSLDPEAIEIRHEEIEEKAESPFETAVASALIDHGYHLVQQWKVGSYRLDIVAVYGKKTVVIECDGDRWHSSESKIREDMERQTILERIGWRFIRIRGSEFYRDPEGSIGKVIDKLSDFGIKPEGYSVTISEKRNTELLRRVKARAALFLSDGPKDYQESSMDVIASALNPKTLLEKGVPDFEATENKKKENQIYQQHSFEEDINGETEDTSLDEDTQLLIDSLSPEKSLSSIRDNKKNTSNKQIPSVDQIKSRFAAGRPILQYDDDGNLIKRFESLSVAAREFNITPACIRNAAKGIQKHAGGFVWRYEDDIPGEENSIINFLEKNNVEYIDKRKSNGALWIIGGDELKPVVDEALKFGIKFKFKSGGGKLTKGKDAWWGK